MVMRFGTWNVSSLYRTASLQAAAIELSKYNLDLVADGWRVVVSQQEILHFRMEMGKLVRLFIPKGIISAFKRVEFTSDRMSFMTLSSLV
jgi:hypothetical protein